MLAFQILLTTLLFFGSISISWAESSHWSYEGDEGPTHWGDISEVYHVCKEGRNQSPIDLKDGVHANLPELVFDYYSLPNRIVNNGHTIQLDIEPGSYLNIPSQNKQYALMQFHFHSPSEHTVDGRSFAMEMHFVHADKAGALAVVGVLVEEGEENPILKKLRHFVPTHAGESSEPPEGIEETNLIPPSHDYFYYSGSLTTPPCSEGVSWMILKNPLNASAEQIANFKTLLGPVSNRPVQPQNSRMILD